MRSSCRSLWVITRRLKRCQVVAYSTGSLEPVSHSPVSARVTEDTEPPTIVLVVRRYGRSYTGLEERRLCHYADRSPVRLKYIATLLNVHEQCTVQVATWVHASTLRMEGDCRAREGHNNKLVSITRQSGGARLQCQVWMRA